MIEFYQFLKEFHPSISDSIITIDLESEWVILDSETKSFIELVGNDYEIIKQTFYIGDDDIIIFLVYDMITFERKILILNNKNEQNKIS